MGMCYAQHSLCWIWNWEFSPPNFWGWICSYILHECYTVRFHIGWRYSHMNAPGTPWSFYLSWKRKCFWSDSQKQASKQTNKSDHSRQEEANLCEFRAPFCTSRCAPPHILYSSSTQLFLFVFQTAESQFHLAVAMIINIASRPSWSWSAVLKKKGKKKIHDL